MTNTTPVNTSGYDYSGQNSLDDEEQTGGPGSTPEERTDATGDNEESTTASPTHIEDDGEYTAADLVALGMDESAADYILSAWKTDYQADPLTISGEKLSILEDDGKINITKGPHQDTVTVHVNPSNGYTVLEIIRISNLTPDDAFRLVQNEGNGEIIDKTAFEAAVDEDGNLTRSGVNSTGDQEFESNRIYGDSIYDYLDPAQEYSTDELEDMGLLPETAAFLTKDGAILGQELVDMFDRGELRGGLVEGNLTFRPGEDITAIPEDSQVSVIPLLEGGLTSEEVTFLVDTYATDGYFTQEVVDEHIIIGERGELSLSSEAQALFDNKNVLARELVEDGADYSELIALGFSSAQTTYLITHYETPLGSGIITNETWLNLKGSGFIEEVPMEGAPGPGNPSRYQLNGENGMLPPDAEALAASMAGDIDENTPILEIGVGGLGNFFTAGNVESVELESDIDTNQSVIYTPIYDGSGNPTGQHSMSNGNDGGYFTEESLVDVGFSEQQAADIWQYVQDEFPDSRHASDSYDYHKDFQDRHVSGIITMSEIRAAIMDDVGGIGSVASVSGQAIIMRQEGEPLVPEPEDDHPHLAQYRPTQMDAEWLNDTYGEGDGLTESELADAFEDGVLQVIDGEIVMTAHGKALAFEAKGPSDGDINTYQTDLMIQAMNKFDPNGSGTNRELTLEQLMGFSNGLTPEDAALILDFYGDGTTVTQEELTEAVGNNEMVLTIDSSSGDPVFELKITPKGYETMTDTILADPDHPYAQKIELIMNYPSYTEKVSVDLDGLMNDHELSENDARALMQYFDVNGDNQLNKREMLQALISGSIIVSDTGQITDISMNTPDSVAHVGPYNIDALAAKINTDGEPRAEDMAKAIFLEHGYDPANTAVELTDQQVETWLRHNKLFDEDENGVLTPKESGYPIPTVDEAWSALGQDGSNDEHVTLFSIREGTNSTENDFGKNGWSREDQMVLSGIMRDELGLGEASHSNGREGDLLLTKEDLQVVIEKGYITIDNDGNLELTRKGRVAGKAHQANMVSQFFDHAESHNPGEIDWRNPTSKALDDPESTNLIYDDSIFESRSISSSEAASGYYYHGDKGGLFEDDTNVVDQIREPGAGFVTDLIHTGDGYDTGHGNDAFNIMGMYWAYQAGLMVVFEDIEEGESPIQFARTMTR